MYNESAVFMSFEENTEELEINVKSLGFKPDKHLADNKMYLEHVHINQDELPKTGRYSMEGLFVSLGHASDKVKANRVVLESPDTLFYSFDPQILRSEFKRLLSWLKEKKVTAIITREIGNGFFSRHGIEEYVADCVIVLDNRVVNQITVRRLRIIKYRGSLHGNMNIPS